MGTQRHRSRTARCAPYLEAKRGRRRRRSRTRGLGWTIVKPGRADQRAGHGQRRPRAVARPHAAEIPRDDVALVLYHCLLADNTIRGAFELLERTDTRRAAVSGPIGLQRRYVSWMQRRSSPGSSLPRSSSPPPPAPRSRRARAGSTSTRRPRPPRAARHADPVAQADRQGRCSRARRATACCSTLDLAQRRRRWPSPARSRSRRARRPRAAGRSSAGRTARSASPTRARRRRARHARAATTAAAQPLAEGRLRGRAHRLRGPRHARRAPVPDRRLRGPQRARHGARRAQAGPDARQAAS